MGDFVPKTHAQHRRELLVTIEDMMEQKPDGFAGWDYLNDMQEAVHVMQEWPVYEEKTSWLMVRTIHGLAWRGATYYEHRVREPDDSANPLDILLPFAILSAMMGPGCVVCRIKTLRPPKGLWSINELKQYIQGLRDRYHLTPLTEVA